MSTQSTARQPIPIGKFFLEQGRITPQQLELALQHRQTFKLKLGQSLVELGFVSEADMIEALRYQARFPCVHLTRGIVDARIAAKVGPEISRRLRAIALNQIAGHTTVALEDPADEEAVEELGHVLATRILAVYSEPSAIRKMLDLVFGAEKGARLAVAPPGPLPAGRTATEGEPIRPPELAGDPPVERAVVERVRGILQLAFEHEVRAIHLDARPDSLWVRFRAAAGLREHARLPASWSRPVLDCLKALAKLEEAEGSLPRAGKIPFTFKKRRYEVEVAVTPSVHGECAVLHVRDADVARPSLAELGLSADQAAELATVLAAPSGLVVVAGVPASGCASTLHALLSRLATPDRKTVVLDECEDHGLDGILHVRLDRRAGRDPARAAEELLRQDPDVLAVGEIEGPATARTLLQAALAGRFALSSLRAFDALDVVARLLRLGLEPFLLGEALRGVVVHRFVRQVCAECQAPAVPDEALRARLGLPPEASSFLEGQGCAACHGTGHRGQLRLVEMLAPGPAFRRDLERGAGPEALARTALAEGFRSFRELGLERARDGLTTLHEVLRVSDGTFCV